MSRPLYIGLAALVLGSLLTRPTAAQQHPIAPAVAPLYVGSEQLLEGQVTAAVRDGHIVRLQVGDPPASITLQLVLGMLSRFPTQPEQHYLGQRIRAFGPLHSFRGQTEMIVRDPDNIAILANQPATAIDPDEHQALQQRVESLERRLEELEGEPTPSTAPTPAP